MWGGGKTLFVIDLQMSYVIKGLACLLILLGHYANMRISPNFSVISKIVWMFSSNVALTWFMFFSGYGMSLKRIKQGDYLSSWWNSVKENTAVIARQENKYNLYLNDPEWKIYTNKQVLTRQFPSGFLDSGNYFLTVVGGYDDVTEGGV